MARHARFRLTFPKVWTHLSDGRYRPLEGLVGDDHEPSEDEVLIDVETGLVRSAASTENSVFAIFRIPAIHYDLATAGSPVAITIQDPDLAQHLRQFPSIASQARDGAGPGQMILEALTPSGCIDLLIALLDEIAQSNARAGTETVLHPSSVIKQIAVLRMTDVVVDQTYLIDYTNYRGDRGTRQIRVTGFAFGTNVYHLVRGLIIVGIDVDRGVERTFASDGIHAIWAYTEPTRTRLE
jgi:hypothetical protein